MVIGWTWERHTWKENAQYVYCTIVIFIWWHEIYKKNLKKLSKKVLHGTSTLVEMHRNLTWKFNSCLGMSSILGYTTNLGILWQRRRIFCAIFVPSNDSLKKVYVKKMRALEVVVGNQWWTSKCPFFLIYLIWF